MRIPVITLFAMMGWSIGSAQNAEVVTENTRRAIVPWNARSAAPTAARLLSGPPSRLYHWAAFKEAPSGSDRAALEAAGVRLLGFAGKPQPYVLYKVRLSGNTDRGLEALQALPVFVNLLPILPEEKVTAKVLRGEFERGVQRGRGVVKATVFLHKPESRAAVEALLRGKVDEIVTEDAPYRVTVSATPQRLLALAELEEVARVEDYQEKLLVNDVSRRLTKVSALQAPIIDTVTFPPTPAWNSGRSFTGDSIWVAVNEGVDMNHQDFRENTASGSVPRLALPGDQMGTSGHGTHVAGIVGGNGWNSDINGNLGWRYQYRGVAPKVRFISAWDAGHVNNHSFIFGADGYYNYNDANIDQSISNHSGTRQDEDNVSVWAAANNGGYWAQYGVQRGYYSMLINAKNAIKVGSVDPNGARSGFSSMGPTRDGRIGPDVMAPGGSVYSVLEGIAQGYTWMGGTSMASPHITGISALLLQKFRENVVLPRGHGANLHDQPPWNSTIKAILVHTAQDMVDLQGTSGTDPDFENSGFPNRSPVFGAGPDFATGYGLVDAQRAAQFVDTNLFRESQIGTGLTASYNITVPSGRSNLRVTLAWDDPPFLGTNDESGAYGNKLVNDLDLVLVSPSGIPYQPWVLDHNALNNGTVPANGLDPATPTAILNNPAYRAKDSRNNLEVIDIPNPTAGTWRIEVRGFSVPVDQSVAPGINQDFSLVSDFALPVASPVSGPDLVISKLTWTPTQPVRGEGVQFRATVLNRGNQASQTGVHGVGFFSNYGIQDSNLTFNQSLAPGQSVVLTSSNPWPIYTSTFALASADFKKVISETKEGNNNLSVNIQMPTLPVPWVSQDIGQVLYAGSANYSGDGTVHSFGLGGAGIDIWGNADEFHFTHRTLNGDGEIRAQITYLSAVDPWAKAGLMIRESTAPTSKHAFILQSYGNGIAFQHRATTGRTSATVGATGNVPHWIRLVRSGNTFTGYRSVDGNTWTQVGTATISMAAQVRVGLAVTSHQSTYTAYADFSQVTVSGGVVSALNGRIANQADNGIAGVTVALSGSTTASTTTNAAGYYSFSNLSASGNFTVTPALAATTFTPANRTFTGLQLDRSADFFGTASGSSLPTPWTTGDIGSVGVVGNASHASGTFTVQGSGADIFGTADAFRYVHQALNGDGEIRARVATLQNTHAYAKAAVMIRDGLGANARHVLAGVTPTSGAEFVRRLTAGGTTTSTQAAGFAAPYWVRLTRVGNLFTAFRSPDGTTWTSLGQETLALPSATRIGLAVTSHNNAVLNTSTFNEVSVLPGTPFQEIDIGSVGVAGNRTVNGGGVQVVRGSGADIYGTADAFHFSYRSMTGDGEIRARVTSVQNTHGYAKGAVMMRDGLAANARHVLAGMTPSNGAEFVRRLTAGGSTTSTQSAGLVTPYWVRLTRVGNVFTAYRSADGVTWTSLGQETLALPSTIQVGLAVTSHNNSVLGSATFDSVQ